MGDLKVVRKHLKKGKSRDPKDHYNEIFHSDTAGNYLQNGIIVIMNKIKDQGIYPQELQSCNISPIYNKGKRNIFDNYRGIFRLTILRSILDRLIYSDVYPIIDRHLTDANVGARKGRNIRDNLFVLNAVTNLIIRGKQEACEIGVYNTEKCFDSLWAQDCKNDLYEAGCTDDKLFLLHQGTLNASVAVKTSGGRECDYAGWSLWKHNVYNICRQVGQNSLQPARPTIHVQRAGSCAPPRPSLEGIGMPWC